MRGLRLQLSLHLVLFLAFGSLSTRLLADTADHPISQPEPKPELQIQSLAVSREEILAHAPEEALSPALKADLEHPANHGFDYLLISLRGIINGAGITYGLIVHNDASFAQAIAPGALGGIMSATLHAYYPEFNFWLKQRGFFRPDPQKRASLIESFFKDFAMNVGYISLVTLATGVTQIQPDLFKWTTFKAALEGVAAEGIWYVWLAKFTEKMLKKFSERADLVWKLSKLTVLGVSAVSTYATVMQNQGHPWATSVLITMGALGALTYISTLPLRNTLNREKPKLGLKGRILSLKEACVRSLRSLTAEPN